MPRDRGSHETVWLCPSSTMTSRRQVAKRRVRIARTCTRWLTAPPGCEAAGADHAISVGHLEEGQEPLDVVNV